MELLTWFGLNSRLENNCWEKKNRAVLNSTKGILVAMMFAILFITNAITSISLLLQRNFAVPSGTASLLDQGAAVLVLCCLHALSTALKH